MLKLGLEETQIGIYANAAHGWLSDQHSGSDFFWKPEKMSFFNWEKFSQYLDLRSEPPPKNCVQIDDAFDIKDFK